MLCGALDVAPLDPEWKPDWAARRVGLQQQLVRRADGLRRREEALARLRGARHEGRVPLAVVTLGLDAATLLFATPEGVAETMVFGQSKNGRLNWESFFGGGARGSDYGVWKQLLSSLGPGEWERLLGGRGGVNVVSVASLGLTLEDSRDPPGVRIRGIRADSPAAGVSLQAGDILTRVERRPIASVGAFEAELGAYGPGARVRLQGVRAGPKDVEVEVVLPPSPAIAAAEGFRAFRSWDTVDEECRKGLEESAREARAVAEGSVEHFAVSRAPVLTLRGQGAGAGPSPVLWVFERTVFTLSRRPPDRLKELEDLRAQFRRRVDDLKRQEAEGKDPQALSARAVELDSYREAYSFLSAMTDADYAAAVNAFWEAAPEGVTPPRSASTSWIGLMVVTLARGEGERWHVREGMKIQEVMKESPAAKADLKVGDVLLRLGQKPLSTEEALREAVQAYAPGSRVKVEGLRDGRPFSRVVTLEGRP